VPLRTAATELTPEIVFDSAGGLLTMQGECYPENPVAFFAPLLVEMQRFLAASAPRTISADFRLRYVNSASSRVLRRVLVLLDAFPRREAR